MPSDQVDRYQLRPGHKDWSDHGPDLLRARDNVRHMLVRRLEDPLTGWFWRQRRGDDPDASEWEGPLKRVKVLAMFDAWAPERDGEAFQFGREVAEGIGHDVQWAVRFADVPLPEPGAPLETRVVAGLMRYAFPTMCPAGICVCKQIGRKVGDPVDPTQSGRPTPTASVTTSRTRIDAAARGSRRSSASTGPDGWLSRVSWASGRRSARGTAAS